MTVILLKPHTHAGEKYPAGTTLAVAKAEAEWLIRHQIARRPTVKKTRS